MLVRAFTFARLSVTLGVSNSAADRTDTERRGGSLAVCQRKPFWRRGQRALICHVFFRFVSNLTTGLTLDVPETFPIAIAATARRF